MIEITRNRHLVLLMSLVAILHKVHSEDTVLKCYKCTSVAVPECGITWGYSDDSKVPDELKVECYGKNAACKKLVSKDAPRAVAHVIRECWNTTDTDTPDEGFLACRDVMKAGESCHCNKDNCNGQGHLIASVSVGALSLCATLLYSLF